MLLFEGGLSQQIYGGVFLRVGETRGRHHKSMESVRRLPAQEGRCHRGGGTCWLVGVFRLGERAFSAEPVSDSPRIDAV